MECVQISLFDKIGTCIDFGVLFCTSLYSLLHAFYNLLLKREDE